ncbi:hypothetical protein M408DRAFT_328845 [Serendipita vermifera MAFF 305830]|uniref:Putative lipoate-protein ligase A n=1 Tax=Serendipita vermifera MAFF 305830 TaxID=933852 RepID=A0A0C3BC23_SERVB|nr:hypothetical protein M408DRAFT_328845 [Serendipita vermifera MAFF 305830]
MSSVYLSLSPSPLFNLSLEELLFRKAPADTPLLLVYKNEPCVVIGRNQNPWKEINHTALQQAGIPFIRRRSGGGTVYHDLGNINFSLHMPRASFERKKGTQLALETLKRLKVPGAWINDRNDVCVGEYKICVLLTIFCHVQYVSGSAYKIINTRAYHHGTMLLNSRLDLLGEVLRNTKDTMVGRSVASVRSPVKNISEMVDFEINQTQFIQTLVESFDTMFGGNGNVTTVTEKGLMGGKYPVEQEFVTKSIKELESWEWKYGQTLEFDHTISWEHNGTHIVVEITAKHGIITKCRVFLESGDSGRHYQTALSEQLIGKRYGLLEKADFEDKDAAFIEFLQREM